MGSDSVHYTIAIELEEVNEPGVEARNEFTRGPRI
jgi:hypothetical protein